MKHITASVLLLSLLLSGALCACGDTAEQPKTDGESMPTAETAAETEEKVEEPSVLPYSYELGQYGDYDFLYLNEDETENNWANCRIAPDETNGETINDALYNRKVRVEEKLDVTIREERIAGEQLVSRTKKTVNAGESTYDAISNRNNDVATLTTGGYLVNMREIPEMHFDEPFWDSVVCDASSIDGRLYFASSDISLFAFEATWVVYFNETLFNRFDIPYPYQLVRDGKWTLDAMYDIVKEGTVVNDEEYNPNGSNVYGMITHNQFMGVLLAGSEEEFITVDRDGVPQVNEQTNHFYGVLDKIVKITGTKGQYIDRVTTKINESQSVPLEFMLGSFLMASETLGHITTLRSMSDGLGILPIPKYDEAQESYHSMVASWGVEMTTIPVTNLELTRTGQVLDYLAYESYISLMEPYYDSYLTMKGARNEDSAEMLSIIRSTRVMNIGYLFSWANQMEEQVRTNLMNGKSDVASILAKYIPKIQPAIEKTITKIKENDA